jgi:hypothetical protein
LVDIAFDHVNHRVEVHVTLNRYVDSFLEWLVKMTLKQVSHWNT